MTVGSLLQEMWFNNAHFEQKTLQGKMILSKVKRLKHEFEFRAILPNLVKFNFENSFVTPKLSITLH
jgi:hypothetical protein